MGDAWRANEELFMKIVEEMLSAANALNAAGLEYAICGGFAVVMHGYSRFTDDIDFLVRPQDVEAVVAALAKVGFDEDTGTLVFKDEHGEPQRVRRVVKFSGHDYLVLDLLHVTPALERIWSERQVKPYKEGQVTVVSYDGLIAMKRMANREQDVADIKNLEEAREKPMDETQA